ncbi:ankyrin repeat protein [Phlyctema vagabunda]|uniref:Ankyrin repeat protein n=1 Tax=Phlyctema vagabunda TaxID=108571 RepID=A0ABR4P2I8_9HELO
MGAHSDVWSLGCIMSMLLTYLEAGWPGVRKYSDERCDERQIKPSDQFFRPPINWTDFRLNSKVLDQHQYLTRQAEERESRDEQALPGEGRAVEHFLDFLEKSVLVTSWRQRRATAKDIKTELARLAEFYVSPSSSSTDVVSSQGISAFSNLMSWSRNVISRSRDAHADGADEERSWFVIPRHTNIKASTITLSGNTIAFWSNEYIRMYTPEMLNEERPVKGKLKTDGVFNKLGQDICYWESVDLNQECLVASTNRHNFDCYVFETQDGSTNGPTPQNKYRIFLQLPKIRRVAISPDNQWFICVVSHELGSDFPGTLLYARMENVLEAARTRSNITEENITRRIPDPASLVCWETPIALAFAAVDLTYLTVSEDNIVFTVLQTSSDTESNQHSIILNSFDISRRVFHTIRLENPVS